MANFYKKLFTKSRERYIRVLQQQTAEAQKKAEYLASPKGLAIGTVKGLPGAIKKVLGFPYRHPLPYSTPWLIKKRKKYKKEKGNK